MINGMSVLAIIPARGGSKGVPRKNIREVGGKPLIAWTIETARFSRYVDRLITSTDDPEIAAVAESCGCELPFLRPAELARDETPGIAPVLHAIEALDVRYDLVVLLQPTSPLRSVEDLDGSLELLLAQGAPACVSVVAPDKSPYWMYRRGEGGGLVPILEGEFTRRQDIPEVFALNGAVYAAKTGWLLRRETFVTPETVGYLMPKERSLDIDDELDLALCSLILGAREGR